MLCLSYILFAVHAKTVLRESDMEQLQQSVRIVTKCEKLGKSKSDFKPLYGIKMRWLNYQRRKNGDVEKNFGQNLKYTK